MHNELLFASEPPESAPAEAALPVIRDAARGAP